jgi:hypothetical protein
MNGLLDVDQFGTKNLGERLITFPKTKKKTIPPMFHTVIAKG